MVLEVRHKLGSALATPLNDVLNCPESSISPRKGRAESG